MAVKLTESEYIVTRALHECEQRAKTDTPIQTIHEFR